MKFSKIVALVSIVAIASVLVAGCAKKAAAPTTTSQDVKVATGDVTISVTSTGNLQYADQENLSFNTDGTMGTINVLAGDLVKKGQVLAVLDPDVWQTYLTALQTTFANAQTAVGTAQTAVGTAQSALTSAQLALLSNQLNVQTAQNNLNNLQAVNTAQNNLINAQNTLALDQIGYQQALLSATGNSSADLVNYWPFKIALDNATIKQAKLDLNTVLTGNSTAGSATIAAITVDTTMALKIAQAQLQIQLAQATLDKSQPAIDAAQTGVTNAQAAVVTAQTAVTNAQKALDDSKNAITQITAPFDGAVLSLSSTAGATVKKNATMMVVADSSKYYADMLVGELDIPNIHLGTQASVQFTALTGVTLPATVTSIAPTATVQSGVVNYEVKAQVQTAASTPPVAAATADQIKTAQQALSTALATAVTAGKMTQAQSDLLMSRFNQLSGSLSPSQLNTFVLNITQGNYTGFGTTPPTTGARTGGGGGTGTSGAGRQGLTGSGSQSAAQLKQGMSLTVTLIEQQKTGVITVPNQAIKTTAGNKFVTVRNADGTTKQVQVTTGLADYQNTEITNGLVAGDTIVITKAASTTTTRTTTPSAPAIRVPGLGG